MLNKYFAAAALAASAFIAAPAFADAPKLNDSETKTLKDYWAFQDCIRGQVKIVGDKARSIVAARNSGSAAAFNVEIANKTFDEDEVTALKGALEQVELQVLAGVLMQKQNPQALCVKSAGIADLNKSREALNAVVEKYGKDILEREEPDAGPKFRLIP